MENSKIEWCHHTFNPWVGCERISPACDNCYAADWAKRTGQSKLWAGERRRTNPANWGKVLKWDRLAREQGVRVRVFCASLADVFDNAVPHQWRVDLFELIAKTTNIDWLLLTKRIGNSHRMLDEVMDTMSHGLQRWEPEFWKNVWIGSTIANQAEADRDIPKLLAVPAAVRFLSCEPVLGPIDLRGLWNRCPTHDFAGGFCIQDCGDWQRLNWVIAGGESGPHARPSHPDWFRTIRDQCFFAEVPFLFKQWGEYIDLGHIGNGWNSLSAKDRDTQTFIGGATMIKVGKKDAGRDLDGRKWDGFPS